MWYTVSNETGEKIDSFMTLDKAVDSIRLYVMDDRINGRYTETFYYDIYNDTYDLYAHGDWKHVYEMAILCADDCTKEEAQKYIDDGALIYADTPLGFSEFVKRYEDNVTPKDYDEVKSAWGCLSSVSFEGHYYKIDYIL